MLASLTSPGLTKAACRTDARNFSADRGGFRRSSATAKRDQGNGWPQHERVLGSFAKQLDQESPAGQVPCELGRIRIGHFSSGLACRVTIGTYPTSRPFGGVTSTAGSRSASRPTVGGGRYSLSFVYFLWSSSTRF